METQLTLPLRLLILQLRVPSDLRDNGALQCATKSTSTVEAFHPHMKTGKIGSLTCAREEAKLPQDSLRILQSKSLNEWTASVRGAPLFHS